MVQEFLKLVEVWSNYNKKMRAQLKPSLLCAISSSLNAWVWYVMLVCDMCRWCDCSPRCVCVEVLPWETNRDTSSTTWSVVVTCCYTPHSSTGYTGGCTHALVYCIARNFGRPKILQLPLESQNLNCQETYISKHVNCTKGSFAKF